MIKSCSVFLIEQKMGFEKFHCFFVDFLRSSFGRIKVMSTVVEREYKPVITRHTYYTYQLTGFYMIRGFTERYFPQLYFRKSLLFRKCTRPLFQTFILNLLCKQLRKIIFSAIRRSYDPQILHIIALHFHYLQKGRNRFRS